MSRFALRPNNSTPSAGASTPDTSSSRQSPKTLAPSTTNQTISPLSNHSTSSSDNDGDEDDDLPYPQALPRSDFLAPNFSATTYLSSLSTRHQTLEDLRSDLRERSQLLSKELLDLVNVNYEQFLNLGLELRGGEEKVEDVRVGLLGFSRGVGEVRERVGARRGMVEGLIKEREGVLREVEIARKMLELGERIEDLEARLMVRSLGRDGTSNSEWSDDDENDEEEDDNDEDETNHSDAASRETGPRWAEIRKLRGLIRDWKRIDTLATRVGKEHPFVRAQDVRMMKIRNTMLLDLGSALKKAVKEGSGRGVVVGGRERLLAVMQCYADVEESREAVRVLKGLKS